MYTTLKFFRIVLASIPLIAWSGMLQAQSAQSYQKQYSWNTPREPLIASFAMRLQEYQAANTPVLADQMTNIKNLYPPGYLIIKPAMSFSTTASQTETVQTNIATASQLAEAAAKRLKIEHDALNKAVTDSNLTDPYKAQTKQLIDTNKKITGKNFFGTNFGVGLSYTQDLGRRDRIGEASLDTAGIVRVDEEKNGNARLVLESHFLSECAWSNSNNNNGASELNVAGGIKYGCGLFVAAQLGSSDALIEAVGGGIMFGFQPNEWDDNRSFNIGFGVMVDPDTKVLGDGVSANGRLPAGETEVRTKQATQLGFMILFSYSWNN